MARMWCGVASARDLIIGEDGPNCRSSVIFVAAVRPVEAAIDAPRSVFDRPITSGRDEAAGQQILFASVALDFESSYLSG